MGRIIYITGGARSGKSRFAEMKALEMGSSIGYIATGIATDEDMADRIRRHQADRPASFATLEGWKDYSRLLDSKEARDCSVFILDCVTVGITNLLLDRETQLSFAGRELDYETCSLDSVHAMETGIAGVFMDLAALVRSRGGTLLLVSNEVGMGLVSPYRLGNIFRDVAGRINQKLAAEADEAYLLVSGLPVVLKGRP